MQILDSLIDGAMQIPDDSERDAYIAALIVYLKTGIEPDDLGPIATACWTMTFPVIENSRKKAENGRKGGERAQANREASGKAKAEANQVANGQANREANGQASEGRFASLSSSSSSSYEEKEEVGEIQPSRAIRLIREQQAKDERCANEFERHWRDHAEQGLPGPVADLRVLLGAGGDTGGEEAGRGRQGPRGQTGGQGAEGREVRQGGEPHAQAAEA